MKCQGSNLTDHSHCLRILQINFILISLYFFSLNVKKAWFTKSVNERITFILDIVDLCQNWMGRKVDT